MDELILGLNGISCLGSGRIDPELALYIKEHCKLGRGLITKICA